MLSSQRSAHKGLTVASTTGSFIFVLYFPPHISARNHTPLSSLTNMMNEPRRQFVILIVEYLISLWY